MPSTIAAGRPSAPRHGPRVLVGSPGASAVEVALRPIDGADEPFLRRLYASTRAAELSPVPWSEEQKQAFCDSQFDLQDAYYRQHYPTADFDIVELDGQPAGRFLVDRDDGSFLILDIAMISECRGRGTGTRLLQWLQAAAGASGAAVVLTVEPGSPAERLYRRLGFTVRASHQLHREMVWRAGAAGPVAWTRFVELVPSDPALHAELAGAVDDAGFTFRAVAAGLARGLVFTEEDVRASLRSQRPGWMARGVR
jgi:ribosomal protein S18 acetylase RimI-like enzyme